MTGGGRGLKNQVKSNEYCSKIFKNLKYFPKRLSNFLSLRCEEGLSEGSILIEFAICMPILVILLFYIHDLVKIKRYYSQTEFVAQQMANMIQNVSKNRENKAIGADDLKYIVSAATLTIYPDNNFSSISNGHKHGHFGEAFLYYVKGNENGTADVVWGIDIHQYRGASNPSKININAREPSNDRSHIKIANGVSPQVIYPTLKIGKNEERIILEVCIDYSNTSYYKLDNGVGCDTVSPSKIFGLKLLIPKGTQRGTTGDFAYFNSVVIFTPKPGLFSETIPS